MILILIACLILHTLNDLLFIICYKFVIILLLYVILFDTFNTKITCFVFRFCVIGTLWKVSKYGVFSWSVFSCIWTEYGDLRSKSSYSVQIRENTDQKKLRVWTLFTQWHHHSRFLLLLNAELNQVLTQTILIQSCFLVRNI